MDTLDEIIINDLVEKFSTGKLTIVEALTKAFRSGYTDGYLEGKGDANDSWSEE